MIDRFGSDVWMVPQDQDHFAATVTITVSPQFFGWVTAIGEDMEIDGPEDVKAPYEQYLERLLFKYITQDHPWVEIPSDDSMDEEIRYSLDEIRLG